MSPLQLARRQRAHWPQKALAAKDRIGLRQPPGAAPCSSPPLCFDFSRPFAVQKPATRAPSRKGRKLTGGTRSLRAAALPFPPAFCLMPACLFCLHGEELGETSHECKREKQHVTAEHQLHGLRI